MKSNYTFPTFHQFQTGEKRKLKRLRSFLRFYLYSVACSSEIKDFETYLTQHPIWEPIFKLNPYRCDALLRKFCDKRFNRKERLNAIVENFEIASIKFHNIKKELVAQESLLLAKLTDNLTAYLNINQIDPFEGFFSINIKDENGINIYDASFTFLAPNKLLIASIQGTRLDNSQQLIRTTTKALHGVRPMFMIVNLFKLMSDILGCELLGIAHQNQAKYRFNDKSKLLFNYDEFWQENDGTLDTQGYWQIPLTIERKPLEDIQSKKRSMYRKRYAMLDDIEIQISNFFKE